MHSAYQVHWGKRQKQLGWDKSTKKEDEKREIEKEISGENVKQKYCKLRTARVRTNERRGPVMGGI